MSLEGIGKGFSGYPSKPRRTKWEMLNLMSLLFGLTRETLSKNFKRKGLDLSCYEDVSVYIKEKMKK